MRRDRCAAVAAIAGLLLAAVSCGNGGDSARAPALTHDEWVTEAQTVCAKFDREAEQIPDAETAEEVGPMTEAVAANMRGMIDELSMLVPPEGDEAVVEEMLDTFDATVDAFEEMGLATAAGEEEAAVFGLLGVFDSHFYSAEAQAIDYGVPDCLPFWRHSLAVG